MARIAIVGDGPGGLSAALFLARGEHEVTVYGLDKTAMHFAFLNNYLGIPAISGTDFQAVARRQVTDAGASIREAEVTAITGSQGGFELTEADDASTYDYVILSEGRNAPLANSLGLGEEGVSVDAEGRTSVDGVYVIGRSVRPNRSQAIISAGAGAAAALDILAREAGDDVQDWDTPPKE